MEKSNYKRERAQARFQHRKPPKPVSLALWDLLFSRKPDNRPEKISLLETKPIFTCRCGWSGPDTSARIIETHHRAAPSYWTLRLTCPKCPRRLWRT